MTPLKHMLYVSQKNSGEKADMVLNLIELKVLHKLSKLRDPSPEVSHVKIIEDERQVTSWD